MTIRSHLGYIALKTSHNYGGSWLCKTFLLRIDLCHLGYNVGYAKAVWDKLGYMGLVASYSDVYSPGWFW